MKKLLPHNGGFSSHNPNTMSAYNWTFFKAAGVDHVLIQSGADIANLRHLDEKLWAVLACPAQGVHFDAGTLAALDADKDGRIRVKDILLATEWISRVLKDPGALFLESDAMPLAELNTADPGGAALLETARGVLACAGKPGAPEITRADLDAHGAAFARMRFNGDGVLPPESAGDPALESILSDILARADAPATDLGGRPGVTRAHLDAFAAAAAEHLAWESRPAQNPAILPLGADTAAAAAAFTAVAAKIDDYFTRCRLVAYDTRAAGPLNRAENDYAAFNAATLSNQSAELAAFPLTKPAAHTVLPLAAGVNPYWAAALNTFRIATLTPFLGDNKTLGEAQWEAIKTRIQPHLDWMAQKPATPVGAMDAARLREILEPATAAALRALFDEEDRAAGKAADLAGLDKCLRLRRHLNRFLNNTVSFADFYDPKRMEISRAGRLYMDGRACDLTLAVADVNAHSALAANSKTCLAYCLCSQPATGAKMNICAAVTAGFAETLWVGRNGLFIDRGGAEWDAAIVKMVDNPISLKEAFWSPWKKLRDMIAEQFQKLLSEKQDAMLNTATQSAANAAAAPVPAPVAGAAAPRGKPGGAMMASSVAAIGIAVGFLSAGLAQFAKAVASLNFGNAWVIPLGVALVILAVSLPSVIITFFKLRGRDFAPLLNAGGWIVNHPVRITFKLGRCFTREGVLPPKSRRQFKDPYADNSTTILKCLFYAVLLGGLAFGGWWLYRESVSPKTGETEEVEQNGEVPVSSISSNPSLFS